MVSLPPAEQGRFELLLVAPLEATGPLVRRLEAHAMGLADPEWQGATLAVACLLKGLGRKVTPLHLRAALALARLSLELPTTSSLATPAIMLQQVDQIARMMRRPDLSPVG